MGRHKTAIAPTILHVEQQVSKKRKRDTASDPKDGTNVVLASAQNADEPGPKKLRKEKKVKKRKDEVNDAAAPADSLEPAPVERNGEAAAKHISGPEGPKKPKKEKKRKRPHEDETQKEPLGSEEEARLKKFETIFAKYQKSAELAQAESSKSSEQIKEGEPESTLAAPELHGILSFSLRSVFMLIK